MPRRYAAFTIVELLVLMVLTALLVAMFLSALHQSRLAADRTLCLNNISQLEKAHWAYIIENDGALLGTSDVDPKSSWTETLRGYDRKLLARSPLDTSPHFGGGTPVNGQYRLTSYAINANLSPDAPGGFASIDQVSSASEAVHFVIKVFEGPNAVRDHVNPKAWSAPGIQKIAANAASQVQVNAHGGDVGSPNARSAYGFLDGHAEQIAFEEIYGEDDDNPFNPRGNGNGGGPPTAPPGRP